MRSLTFSFFPAPGLRMPARKANDFGFRARTTVRKNGVGEPDGAKVRARLPAKPMNSVSEREPRPERNGKSEEQKDTRCCRIIPQQRV